MQVFQQKHIQLYEHDSLRVGEEHDGYVFTKNDWNLLLQLNEQQYPPYLQPIHRGIRTLHYVGLIQLPGLCLEILPKTERKGLDYHRHLLFSLLQRTGKIPKLPIHNLLSAEEDTLADHFIRQFLNEVEGLSKRGLVREYRRTLTNSNRFKGKLLVKQQIQYNYAHKERVFTEYQAFDENHRLHAILREALDVARHISSHSDLRTRARQLKGCFPFADKRNLPKNYWKSISLSRRDQHYAQAMAWARLILEMLSPVMQTGTHSCHAFLFDMQQLFENVVGQELAAVVAKTDHSLSVQPSRNFWKQRKIRPDLVLKSVDGENMILDTKWKLLKNGQPDEADLKQMYIYNHYFQAQRSFLIYPQQGIEAFGDTFTENTNDMRCEVVFADLVDENGRFKANFGQELIQRILLKR